MAAVEACRGLRESGFCGEIDILAPDDLPTYNPMLVTYYAAGLIDYSAMFPYGDSNEVFSRYGVRLHKRSPAVKLSAAGRAVTTSNGETMRFDKCLIASGASPLIPPIERMSTSRILTIRTVDDAMRLKSALEKKPQRVVVVGASMVGAKLTELFLRAGSDVVLADRADRIFPLSAHPDCSRIIEERLLGMGVKLRFSTEISRAADTPEGLEICFKNDLEPLYADILLMCAGVRANIGFVDRDEIETRQGVPVDCRMESSVPGIYAAGDTAQGTDLSSGAKQIVGILSNARRQGYAAGCNMAGANIEYAGELPHNIVHFLGMNFVGIGDPNCCDRCESMEEGGRFAQIFYRDGKICGANMLDFFSEAGTFKNALRKSKILSNDRSGHVSQAWGNWPDWQNILARMDPRGFMVLRLRSLGQQSNHISF